MATDDDLDVNERDEETPPAKTSGLTLVLCILNVLAAVGFTYLLILDYSKRQAWSHAVFMHDLRFVGLPLKDEAISASRLIVPKQNLDNAALKAVYTKRGGKSISEPFEQVNEFFQFRILPEHLSDPVLNEHFQGVGSPVKTLEAEIERIKGSVLEDIAKAAKDLAEGYKKDAEKRTVLRNLLMSLARSTEVVKAIDEKLEQKLKTAPAAKLDELLVDAAQRRMLVDILAPLEVHRGAPVKPLEPKFQPGKKLNLADLDNAQMLTYAGDVDGVHVQGGLKLEKLQSMLTHRLEAAVADKYDPSVHFGEEWRNKDRDTVDRRKAIANIVCTIAHVGKAGWVIDPKEPTKHLLYADGTGPERAMAVVGMYEYALAYQNLTGAFLILRPYVLALIEADREGIVHEADGKQRRIGGFVQAYDLELREMRLLIDNITKETKRLADLREQETGHTGVVAERTKQVAANTAELLKSRAKTAEQSKELERLQRELFEAQQQLVNAVKINERLNNEIREALGAKKRKALP